MRHKLEKTKLNRKPDHRRWLQRNLVTAFLKNGQTVTTLAKARYLQSAVEALMSAAGRKPALGVRRRLAAFLTEDVLGLEALSRQQAGLGRWGSGLTRLTKLSPRRGDGAGRARLEWTPAAREALVKKKTDGKRKGSPRAQSAQRKAPEVSAK